MEPKHMEVSNQYQPNDEIDLFELFSSLFQQWRCLLGVTLTGVLLAVAIALYIPKEYEVMAQVTLPGLSDVMKVVNNGYSENDTGRDTGRDTERDTGRDTGRDSEKLFQRYYNRLESPVNFNSFVEEGGWLERVYRGKVTAGNRNYLQSELRKGVAVTIIRPVQPKSGMGLPPRVLGIATMGVDEVLMADLINEYIEYTNNSLLDVIKHMGEKRALAEIEKIKADIGVLRFEAKINKEAQLVKLREALVLAKKVGLRKPDSIRLFAESNQRSIKGLTSETNGKEKGLFLMGSEYLDGEIDNLTTRRDDGPYISGLPQLIKRIKQLESLSFDFEGVKLYTLDELAIPDGRAEKPRGVLIVAVGGVLSLFVGAFVALIVGAVNRRKTVA